MEETRRNVKERILMMKISLKKLILEMNLIEIHKGTKSIESKCSIMDEKPFTDIILAFLKPF